METWTRIVEHVTTRFPHAVRECDEALRFVAVLDGRRVGLRLRSMTAYGVRVAMITADLGAMDSLDPWTSLVLNAQLAAGSLAIVNQTLVLRALLDAAATDDEIDRCLTLVTREATTLKTSLSLPRRAAAGFDCFCD